jgi:hypothetical protein
MRTSATRSSSKHEAFSQSASEPTYIPTADKILVDVARAQRRSVVDLAGAVIESCANDSTPLPQRLYTNASGISDAA